MDAETIDNSPSEQSNRRIELREWRSERTGMGAMVAAGLVVAAVIYLLYDNYQFKRQTTSTLFGISEQLTRVQESGAATKTDVSNLKQDISQAREAVGSNREEWSRVATQIKQELRQENSRTKAELGKVLAAKADNAQVEAIKQEANTKLESVNNDIGGVKTDVGTVKTDLASTRVDLEGTKRQLLDVKDTLSAAVARNSDELSVLRRRGEREYVEFRIPKKKEWVSVGDIRLALSKTDPKKSKFDVRILVDDNQLEKKDRHVNEPLQFLVGKGLVRYELVINWVKKDEIGGYLSIPKDKSLAAEAKTTAP